MLIHAIPSGPFATNAYIVSCPETKKTGIIDPAPQSAASISAYIEKNHLIPEKILITHSHWDHIADTAALKELYNIPVYIHPDDAYNLIRPGSDGLPYWMEIRPVNPTGTFVDEDEIPIGNLKFKVIHTPGHTPGGVCFYNKEYEALISGDTLFKSSCGNISFPTSDPKLMWSSLKKLWRLPPTTVVYPGHGQQTTIGDEDWLPNAEIIFGN